MNTPVFLACWGKFPILYLDLGQPAKVRQERRMVGTPANVAEAGAIAAEPGDRVQREGVAVARAEPPTGPELEHPQTALLGEIREPPKILRRRWAGPSFLLSLGCGLHSATPTR